METAPVPGGGEAAISDPTSVIPREGEIAFAISVSTLYDLTVGRVGWPVRFTRNNSADRATLTLRNQTPGGPVLDILDWTGTQIVTQFTNTGIDHTEVGGYLDFHYQPAGVPVAPGAGTDTLRMYSRDGQLYFKAEDSPEVHVPLGEVEGPTLRYAYWLSGG